MSYFVDIGNKECFAALLYLCFDLLRADVVAELSWQHGLNDFYMPYYIQNQRRLVERVSSPTRTPVRAYVFGQLATLEKEVRERSEKEKKKEQQEEEEPIITPGMNRLMITQGNGYVQGRRVIFRVFSLVIGLQDLRRPYMPTVRVCRCRCRR